MTQNKLATLQKSFSGLGGCPAKEALHHESGNKKTACSFFASICGGGPVIGSFHKLFGVLNVHASISLNKISLLSVLFHTKM